MRLPKDILKIPDLSRAQVDLILKEAFRFKNKKGPASASDQVLRGKAVALIFEKNSLRTRVAFEAAISYLGGQPIFLSGEDILYRADKDTSRESIEDITRTLDRLAHGIAARVKRRKTLVDIAAVSRNPLINLLCDTHHPTQAISDVMTIRWHKGKKKVKVTFVGDGNNVATSLMDICALMGHDFSIASPQGYEIKKDLRENASRTAAKSKSKIEFLRDPKEAVLNADVVYTDTFVSMGDEGETARREKDFVRYRVDAKLMSHAKKDALFMHCLPAHRESEVSAEVMDGRWSVIFDEAEARLHVAKALLYLLFR